MNNTIKSAENVPDIFNADRKTEVPSDAPDTLENAMTAAAKDEALKQAVMTGRVCFIESLKSESQNPRAAITPPPASPAGNNGRLNTPTIQAPANYQEDIQPPTVDEYAREEWKAED